MEDVGITADQFLQACSAPVVQQAPQMQVGLEFANMTTVMGVCGVGFSPETMSTKIIL